MVAYNICVYNVNYPCCVQFVNFLRKCSFVNTYSTQSCPVMFVSCVTVVFFNVLFQELASMLSPYLTGKVHSVERKLMCFLWLMGNTESFRSVADRFGMNKSTLHLCISNVADVLFKLAPQELIFPNDVSVMHAMTRTFDRFPGIIGCVDGTYIPMIGKTGPRRDSYICRKGFPALHAQIVCDNDLRILDITTGYPGSVHDARVFKNSSLYQRLQILPASFHLLGDSAYPLEPFIMTPYKDNGHLTAEQKKYNAVHSSSRCCVERCIGLLKGKFRRLKYFDAKDDLLMCKLIVGSAVVHNVILSREGIETEVISVEPDASDTDTVTRTQNGHASAKRDKICRELSVL